MTASAYRLAPALDAGFTLRDRWASLRPRLVVAVLAVMTCSMAVLSFRGDFALIAMFVLTCAMAISSAWSYAEE